MSQELNVIITEETGFVVDRPTNWDNMSDTERTHVLRDFHSGQEATNIADYARTFTAVPWSAPRPSVALETFLRVFSAGDTLTENRAWAALTCTEAEAFGDLLAAHGLTAEATALIDAHREDDPEECAEFGHREHPAT